MRIHEVPFPMFRPQTAPVPAHAERAALIGVPEVRGGGSQKRKKNKAKRKETCSHHSEFLLYAFYFLRSVAQPQLCSKHAQESSGRSSLKRPSRKSIVAPPIRQSVSGDANTRTSGSSVLRKMRSPSSGASQNSMQNPPSPSTITESPAVSLGNFPSCSPMARMARAAGAVMMMEAGRADVAPRASSISSRSNRISSSP